MARLVDASTVDVRKLPSLPMEDRRKLPTCAGIYFAYDNLYRMLYIGRAISIYRRWLDHHRTDVLSTLRLVRIAWYEHNEIEDLPELEAAFIAYHSPIFNGIPVVMTHDDSIVSQFNPKTAYEQAVFQRTALVIRQYFSHEVIMFKGSQA